MTFAVLLNTIVLSINHYGIKKEIESMLEEVNEIFTYLFIAEMALKLLALGVPKYT